MTSGELDVPEGTATISGDTIVVLEGFSKEGEGTLIANSYFLINNAAAINGGTLAQNGTLSAAEWGGPSLETPCSQARASSMQMFPIKAP